MTSVSKQIVHLTMNAEKKLSLTGCLEPSHLPFLLTRVLMRDFRQVVGIVVLAVGDRRHDLFPGSSIASKLVSYS